MPAKHTVKTYIPDGYYHVYNRGVNKMNIFVGIQDYRVFLTYLKSYFPKMTWGYAPYCLMSIRQEWKRNKRKSSFV